MSEFTFFSNDNYDDNPLNGIPLKSLNEQRNATYSETANGTVTHTDTLYDFVSNEDSMSIPAPKFAIGVEPGQITFGEGVVPVTFTLTLDGNGGAFEDSETTKVYNLATGASQVLPAATYEGHTLSGWSTTSTGSVVYGAGATYVMAKENATLHAIWEAVVTEESTKEG